jgi:hypothetical protein
MSDELKQQIALTALNEMMRGNHFNICAIDRVADMLGVNARASDAHRTLCPLHCVDWDKMPQQVREAVPGLIQECLGVAPVFQFKTITPEVIDVTPTMKSGAVKKSGFLRLLGGG